MLEGPFAAWVGTRAGTAIATTRPWKVGNLMATMPPVPEDVELRYGSASVFGQADVYSPHVRELAQGDPFTIDGTEGDFYRVTLPDGVAGFIYAHNLRGNHMPLTDRQQHDADDRAAAAARPSGGWRGTLNRLLRNH